MDVSELLVLVEEGFDVLLTTTDEDLLDEGALDDDFTVLVTKLEVLELLATEELFEVVGAAVLLLAMLD